MENKGIKRSFNYLSNYETAYNTLKNTPWFKQDDWDILSKRSSDELSSYSNMVSQFDKLPNYDEMNQKYFLDDMDVDQRTLFMYKELYANNTDVKDYDIVVGYDDAGKEIKQKQQMTEKQYYDKLFDDWGKFAAEQHALTELEFNKANRNFWGKAELVANSVNATVGEFIYSIGGMIRNILNFSDAITWATWDALAYIGTGDPIKEGFDKFREYMSDDKAVSVDGKYTILADNYDEGWQEIYEWERNNTYFIDADGTRTTAGKLVGDTAKNIGPMVATMALTAALGPAGAGLSTAVAGGIGTAVYYGSNAAGELTDRFKDPKFASTPTSTIVLETGIRTAAEYAIEQGLGKLFGATGMDLLRGASGVGKKSTGFTRYLADALQEGAEEAIQEFSGWAVEQFVGLFRDEYRSDLDIGTLVDAAIGGFMSSLVLGGFAEIREASVHHALSKSLVSFDENYVNLADGKYESKEQREYRKAKYDMYRTAQTISDINIETVDTKSYVSTMQSYKPDGKIVYRGQYGYGLKSINDAYENIAKDLDLTKPEGRELLAKLNLQLYTSYKTIMDMYGEFGAERVVKAETLLENMNKHMEKYADRRDRAAAIVSTTESTIYAKSLVSQIDSLLKDKTDFDAKKAEKLKEATEKVEKQEKSKKTTKSEKSTKKDESKSTKKEASKSAKKESKVDATKTFTEKESKPIEGRKQSVKEKPVDITEGLKKEIKENIETVFNETKGEPKAKSKPIKIETKKPEPLDLSSQSIDRARKAIQEYEAKEQVIIAKRQRKERIRTLDEIIGVLANNLYVKSIKDSVVKEFRKTDKRYSSKTDIELRVILALDSVNINPSEKLLYNTALDVIKAKEQQERLDLAKLKPGEFKPAETKKEEHAKEVKSTEVKKETKPVEELVTAAEVRKNNRLSVAVTDEDKRAIEYIHIVEDTESRVFSDKDKYEAEIVYKLQIAKRQVSEYASQVRRKVKRTINLDDNIYVKSIAADVIEEKIKTDKSYKGLSLKEASKKYAVEQANGKFLTFDDALLLVKTEIITGRFNKEHNGQYNFYAKRVQQIDEQYAETHKDDKIVYCCSIDDDFIEGFDVKAVDATDLIEYDIIAKAMEIKAEYDGDFAIMDVDEVKYVDDILFVDPKSALVLGIDDIVKTAAENELIEAVEISLPDDFKREISKMYESFINGYCIDMKHVVANMLFNKRFYNFALNSSNNYRIFNILKVLDNFSTAIADKLGHRKQLFEAVKRVKTTIGPVLAWYCCTHIDVNLENVTVFTNEQLKYIREHRINYQQVKPVLTGDTRNANYDKMKNRLINTIKTSNNITEEERNMYLNRLYKGTFNGQDYEDLYLRESHLWRKNKLHREDYSHAIFNTMLDELKIDLDTVFGYYIDSDENALNDLKNRFESYTNNTWTFDVGIDGNRTFTLTFIKIGDEDAISVSSNKLEVIDENYNTYNVQIYDVYNPFDLQVAKSTSNYTLDAKIGFDDNTSVIKLLSPILKTLDKLTYTYLSVKDVILNPVKYLKQQSINAIVNDTGSLTSLNVLSYLNDFLHSKGYHISMKTTGDVAVLKLNSVEETFGRDIFELSQYFIDLITEYSNKPYNRNKNNEYGIIDGTSGEITEYPNIQFSRKLRDIIKLDNVYEKYIDDLLNIDVKFMCINLPGHMGSYNHRNNEIVVYLDNHYNTLDLIDTIWHEFVHAIQLHNQLSHGFSTNAKIDNNVVRDYLLHTGGDEAIKAFGKSKNIGHIIVRRMYEASFGENEARGDAPTYAPFIMHSDLIIAPWGSIYVYNSDEHQYELLTDASPTTMPAASRFSLKTVLNTSTENDTSSKDVIVQAAKKKVPKYEEYVKYKNAIDKALDIVKLNIKNGIKTTPKDLSNLGLPADIKKQIVRGEYTKTLDTMYQDAASEIARVRRKGIRKTRINQRQENKYKGKGVRLFKKNVEGTNLMNWIDKNPEGAPYLSEAAQKFVIEADDLSKLPDVLRKAITNATLTDATIYDFVRDAYNGGMDQYVFDALKKSYFIKTPFETFDQVVEFTQSNLVINGYALQAAFKSVGLDDYINEILSKDPDKFKAKIQILPKLFEQGLKSEDEYKRKKYEKMWNTYNDVLDRFESTVFKKSKTVKESDLDKDKKDKDKKDKDKKDKDEDKTVAVSISTITKTFDIADAHQDILLGLLNYFRGTISDVAYVAGNAKRALSKETLYNVPFTYKGKKDISKQKNTVSLDAEIGGKKGDDKSRSLDEIIADEVKQVELQSSEDDLVEIKYNIEQIVHDELLKQINRAKKKGKSINTEAIEKTAKGIHNRVKNYDYNEAVYRLALLNTRDLTGYTTAECLGIEKVDIKTTEVKPSTEQKDALVKLEKKFYNNSLNKVRSTINKLTEKISLDDYKRLPEEFKTYIIKDGKSLKYNTVELKKLSKEQLDSLNEKLLEYKRQLKTKEFATQSSTVKRMEKTIAKKDKEIEKLKKKLDKKVEPKIYTVDLFEGVSVESGMETPEKMKQLYRTTFGHEHKSTMKFYAAENETNFRVSAEDFYKLNAEVLSELTYDDALEIVEYFENANVTNEDYTPYKSFQLFIMAYIIEQFHDKHWTDPEYLQERVEKRITAVVQTAARLLGNWRGLIKKVKPTQKVMLAMAASYGVDLTDEEIAPLTNVLNTFKTRSERGMNLAETLQISKSLNQVVKNLERVVLEKARKQDKDAKLTKLDYIKWTNKILKFQKAAMLSAPATIVRNWLSNVIINGFDIKGKHIWGMNDVSDWIGNMFRMTEKGKNVKSNLDVEQYNFNKVQVSDETAKWINDFVVDSGLLDLLADGLTKYDARRIDKGSTIQDELTDMVLKTLKSRVINDHTFGKGKVTELLESKTGRNFEHGVMDNIVNFVFKLQSDQGSMKKSAVRYLGKMLTVDKVDLSQGLNDPRILQKIADAYSMAAYDHMHRSNFFTDIETTFQKKWPVAYLGYKITMPFLSSNWNWFLDTLQMNPVALFNNIRKLNNIEKVVDAMEDRKQKGDYSSPDSRFAEMIVRRNIGRGVIGTVGWILGAALAMFGKLRIDEEDDKIKLCINDTYFDIKQIYGSSSLLVGASFVTAFNKKGEGDKVYAILESALSQQFEDSLITTFLDMFRYEDTPGQALIALPFNIASGFIPNVWKATVNLTRNKKVEYSDNKLLAELQYMAIQCVPFFETTMNTQIDPYTGETQMRYASPAVYQLIKLLGSPVNVTKYQISDTEVVFRTHGLNKQMLKGQYDDIGKVDKIALNKFYGKLNNQRVNDFVNGKTKYRIEVKEGVYKDLSYNQMDTEQRKSVLNRITTQNANYAKIYVWTSSGHKYYCSSDKRAELIKLGINKNIYIGKEKFAK